MNKKTRDKWGSNEDWDEFYSFVYHTELIGKEKHRYVAGIADCSDDVLGSLQSAGTREEARRLAVEDFCTKSKIPLPWHPDYDLSTEVGCREAIRANGYDEAEAGVMGMRIWLYVKGKEVKQIDEPIAPSLGLWQKTAQWCIGNPAGDK